VTGLGLFDNLNVASNPAQEQPKKPAFQSAYAMPQQQPMMNQYGAMPPQQV
jgi:hypothetical protein